MIIGAVRLPAFCAPGIATGKGKAVSYLCRNIVRLLGCGLTFKDQFPVEVD